MNARAPTCVSELRGFLGLVQYVGRYFPALATVAAPLWELKKKSVKFQWRPVGLAKVLKDVLETSLVPDIYNQKLSGHSITAWYYGAFSHCFFLAILVRSFFHTK